MSSKLLYCYYMLRISKKHVVVRYSNLNLKLAAIPKLRYTLHRRLLSELFITLWDVKRYIFDELWAGRLFSVQWKQTSDKGSSLIKDLYPLIQSNITNDEMHAEIYLSFINKDKKKLTVASHYEKTLSQSIRTMFEKG